jgi:hypothetical protein
MILSGVSEHVSSIDTSFFNKRSDDVGVGGGGDCGGVVGDDNNSNKYYLLLLINYNYIA